MGDLEELQVHPDVDMTTAGDTAFKRLDGTRVTVGQVAEAQARLLDLVHRTAKGMTRSGNPGRSAAGAEVIALLRGAP